MQNSAIEPLAESSEHAPAAEHQMEDVEALLQELKRLLVRHETVLDEEGIRREVEILERWVESYRRGLAAAHKIAETGTVWLSELRDRLKLTADERHRLEGEGGNPPSREQTEKTEELLKTIRRIENVLPNVVQMFHPATNKTDEETL